MAAQLYKAGVGALDIEVGEITRTYNSGALSINVGDGVYLIGTVEELELAQAEITQAVQDFLEYETPASAPAASAPATPASVEAELAGIKQQLAQVVAAIDSLNRD